VVLGVATVAGTPCADDGGPVVSGPPPPTGFYTVAPCRLVDTRNAAGPRGGPALAAASTRSFPVTDACGVPATATSLSVNVAAVGPAAAGYVTVYRGGADTAPLASTVNFAAGATRANNAIVAVAVDGTGTINAKNGSAGTVHFVLDVNGYFE
jgi:hypothetical protein